MKILVWDKPVRIFHWMLVSSYIAVFFTSRSEWLLEYHTAAGYIALGLVVFRILWGLTGSHYARFSEFLKGWGEVKAYLLETVKLKPPRYVGHNPAVGWVVVFMLLLTAVITITGIITYSGEENRGLWAGLVSYETASYAKGLHKFLAYGAVAMIVMHVSAALFHDFVLKENIILSMFTGMKEDEESWGERVSHMQARQGFSAVQLVVWLIVTIMGGLGLIYLPPTGKADISKVQDFKIINDKGLAVALRPNKTWESECTSCHSAFHPTLLPAASWEKIMWSLEDHFGDDASLENDKKMEVLDFLTSSSAEHSVSEASRKILRSIKKGEVPLRITETSYWKRKHSEIPLDVFGRKSVKNKTNCKACHPWAERGSFEDADIRVPN
jgi:cytochrome b